MLEFLRPELTVERDDQDTSRYVRSYLIMRVVIGALGIALPIALVLIDASILDGELSLRGSVSAYYYSAGRELFVGTLCATGVFLITYKVATKSLDNTLSIVGGAAVLLVALLPTGRPDKSIPLTPLQERVGESWIQWIHYGAAVTFIVSLAVICYFFGVREGKREPHAGKLSPDFWRRYHWTCAGAIVAALLFIPAAKWIGWPPKSIFIGETASAWAFGASWLMKGLELDILRGKSSVPEQAA